MEEELNQSNTMADSKYQHLQPSRECAPPLNIQDAIVTSLGFGVMMHLCCHQWIELQYIQHPSEDLQYGPATIVQP